jgi:hypothetical protein
MSLRIRPPFPVVRTISDRTDIDPDDVSLQRLREVVAGRATGYQRLAALRLLEQSDFPNKHRDFEALLANEGELPSIRRQAAISLGNVNTPAAHDALVRHLVIADARVFAAIVASLGRIGDRSALERLRAIRGDAPPRAMMAVEMAVSLIAHRLRLDGDESMPSHHETYVEASPDELRPFHVSHADRAESELALRSLQATPYGVEFAESHIYYVRCGRMAWTVLFNQQFVEQDAVRQLAARKAFAVLVAMKDIQGGRYSPALVVLTTPNGEGAIDLVVRHTHGHIAFRGTATIRDDRAEFVLRAVSGPGAFALEMAGSYESGRLEMHNALSGVRVRDRRTPASLAEVESKK